MIIFNTLKKAQHYVNYLNNHAPFTTNDMCYDEYLEYYIEDRYVKEHWESEVFCSASDPESGYVCCSDTKEHIQIIGIIKKPLKTNLL